MHQQVLNTCPEEFRVFSTNERVPCLLYFESQEDPDNANVCNALFKKLHGEDAVMIMETPSSRSSSENCRNNARRRSSIVGNRRDSSTNLQQELLSTPERRDLITSIFGELWIERKNRIRALSTHGSLPGWNLTSFIAKVYFNQVKKNPASN